jgi:hypothetical protein
MRSHHHMDLANCRVFPRFLEKESAIINFVHFNPSLPTEKLCRFNLCFKSVHHSRDFGDSMLENSNGKLLVYASGFASHEERLNSVSTAAEKMAKLLKLGFEIVTFNEEKGTPISVYYKNGNEDAIPIYCDKGKKATKKEIYGLLRNMIFVLSFHPKYPVLKPIRKEVIQFS